MNTRQRPLATGVNGPRSRLGSAAVVSKIGTASGMNPIETPRTAQIPKLIVRTF